MYKIHRTDANQKEIVNAARKMGATVQSLASVGDGCPDLLIGYRGHNFLAEIKDGKKIPSKRRLKSNEKDWHENWRGEVFIINSVDELIETLNHY